MATPEHEAMRVAVHEEFSPLGVSEVRCASIATRLLESLDELGWTLTRMPERVERAGATGEYPLERDDGLPDG